MHQTSRYYTLAFCGAFLAFASTVSAQLSYAVEPLGVSIMDGWASALTRNEALVGYSTFIEVLSYQGFRWAKGRRARVKLPKFPSYPVGINNTGEIAGNYLRGSESDPFRIGSFLFSNGQSTNLHVETKGRFAGAVAINNAGQIVDTGAVSLPGGPFQAFFLENGTFSNLGTSGGCTRSSAADIAANGAVALNAIASPMVPAANPAR